MARPRRSQHTRDALLNKGLELFKAQGYHGTGIGQILKTLGVPKGSFYNFFDSKEAFVAEVIDLYSDGLLGMFDEHLRAWDGPVLEALEAAWQLLIASHEEGAFRDGCLVGNMVGEINEANTLCQAALCRSMVGMRQRLVDALERGQASGEVRADHAAAELADFIWDAWQGSLLRAKVERSARPLTRTTQFLIEDFLPA